MIRMKNRNQSPVNGWQFYEATTGWDLVKQVPAAQWDFNLAVASIQAHRQKNPRFKLTTDAVAIGNELDHVNALRMQHVNGAEFYIQSDESPPPKMQPQHSPGLPSVAGSVSRVATGVQSLVDWIGSGAEAVPQDLANKRAATCAGCQFNDKGDWTRLFTMPVSNAIRSELSKRAQWKLSTEHDASLQVCSQCLCPLPLMVHVPLEAKMKHMNQNVYNSLPEWCWIKTETKK